MRVWPPYSQSPHTHAAYTEENPHTTHSVYIQFGVISLNVWLQGLLVGGFVFGPRCVCVRHCSAWSLQDADRISCVFAGLHSKDGVSVCVSLSFSKRIYFDPIYIQINTFSMASDWARWSFDLFIDAHKSSFKYVTWNVYNIVRPQQYTSVKEY